MKKLPIYLIGAVLCISIGAAAAWLYPKLKKNVYEIKGGSPGAQPSHIRGAQQPRVTIEEFGDFQCPPCGKLHPVLKEIEENHADSVAVIFREFPMTQLHPNALEAARAAEAAGLQGQFWEMHDFIFDTQEMWSNWKDPRGVFARHSSLTGLNPAKLRQDMDSPEVQKRIEADQQRGQSLGVTGTPTVFLNGRLVAPDDLERLPDLVKSELAKK